MKIRLQNEYYRKLKRILKSKLNGKNVIMAVNTWAVSVLRYEAGVINRTEAELESIDREARKQMTIYGMLHPHTDVQRFHLPRGQGGSGLKSVYTRPLMVAIAKEGLPLKEKTLTQKQLKEQKELERAEGKLAQAEYKHWHDNVARMIYWSIAHSYGLDVSSKWYEHKPKGVIENDHVKLLWDFNIQTSTYIQARRPDVVVVDRDKKTCNIIDIAVPVDAEIVEKEKEKVEKYQDL